jgi:outer membrane receptor protein involved in Fe transport
MLNRYAMKRALVAGASLAALAAANPAFAQEVAADTVAVEEGAIEEIVVTAQRQAESLQDVPIAVSAFSGEALEAQQIENTADLQLSLPNITFTKTNFTSSNFSIRGIGESVVATSADAGVGVHINDMPVNSPRLFEIEFFDLERLEVLRGPQGTLFGRNATGGVVNLITARPKNDFAASADVEYGNYDSLKFNGMVNVPVNDTLGFRVAGIYTKRDGYTKNLFDSGRIDGRDSYAVRGSVRWEPTDATTVDLIGQYFREDSDRSRIQKQLCNRDPSGVLGCSPDLLQNESVNGNSTLAGVASSAEFLRVVGAGALAPFALGSVYGPDAYAGVPVPDDLRTVNIDYKPTYRADETIAMAKIEHDFGDLTLNVTGGYQETSVVSRTDYNLTVGNSLATNAGFQAFRALFPTASRLVQNGNICVSDVNNGFTGYVGGFIDRCAPNPTEYDQSNSGARQYSLEAHIDSQFDGPFNFLLGGIYFDYKSDSDYFIAASALDYASALLGAGQAGTVSPIYDNEVDEYRLKAYAVFGEGYYEFSDALKLTLGLRYTTDDKSVRDRQAPLLTGGRVPFGTTSINVPYRSSDVKFDRLTGRLVLDWQPTDETLVYASYSRGYKGGGINPPFNPALFTAPANFKPETINAFEIGTKNTLLDGTFRANVTAFYYDYKDYQVSRIINRTSFNDNTDATVYGLEGEFLIAPIRPLQFNINASYLKTKIKDLQLVDARDPSGGRSDVVIIKDVTSAANCAVIPTAAGAPRADALVNAVNAAIGLRPTTAIQGTSTTGAFSVCSALQSALATTGVNPALAVSAANPALSSLYTVSDGVAVDLSGNELQNSPEFKFAVGAQYTHDLANDMSIVARVDYSFTGDYFGRNFNRNIDRIDSYDVVNAQLTLNGPDDRWYLRGFVQNLTKNDAITGMYVTDPASGLFTNVFTLEPRRYGIAAGVRF